MSKTTLSNFIRWLCNASPVFDWLGLNEIKLMQHMMRNMCERFNSHNRDPVARLKSLCVKGTVGKCKNFLIFLFFSSFFFVNIGYLLTLYSQRFQTLIRGQVVANIN